jgi:hypothetical protein
MKGFFSALLLGLTSIIVLPAGGAMAAPKCGWAITTHEGSTFSTTSASLMIKTSWCWENGRISSTPILSHRSETTAYGTAGGWRVGASYDGAKGFLAKNYTAEAKADWKLVACGLFLFKCITVKSGTAYAQHLVTGSGTVYKTQGGWP